MAALVSLWLPILVSAVGVFVASSIVWMAMPHHKTDWRKLPKDDAFLDAVRAQGAAAGQYMFPGCTPGDMKNPEAKARFDKGPWGTVILLGGPPNMGKTLPLWFFHLVLVSIFSAYVASLALQHGADFKSVFRFVSATSFLAYAGGAMPNVIWMGQPKSNGWKAAIDALAYALVTGAIFGWLWPHAAGA